MRQSELNPSAPPPAGATANEEEPVDFGLFVRSVRDYAIFMLDPAGYVQTWNPGAEHIKGYREDEIVGKHFSTFYPREDIEAGKPAMELRVAAAQGRFEDEGWRIRKDGSRFWANVVITAVRSPSGKLKGFGKVTRDLTERRAAEETLRYSEERFRLLLGSVKDYAIHMVDPTGIVTSWSSGAEAVTGYRADEIIGQHFSRFYPPEAMAEGRPAREIEIAREVGRYEEEGERVRKDGTRFWASIVLTPIRKESGELIGFAKVTRDLTERKRAEDERLRLAHAQEAVRLRDEFLSIASHELKTPLTALHLQLHRLLENAELGERTAKQVERAARSSSRLIALVETLLDVVRITSGRLTLLRERFEMGAAIREIVYAASGEAAKAGAALIIHEKGRVEGSWDRLRVEQVFTNLISNAIKYGGGTPIDIYICADGQGAKINVADRGPGIAEEDRERIFQRFERAAPMAHFGGLGLGLYITRQIVEAHGGSIELSSEPGAGATFTVRLPLEPPDETAA